MSLLKGMGYLAITFLAAIVGAVAFAFIVTGTFVWRAAVAGLRAMVTRIGGLL